MRKINFIMRIKRGKGVLVKFYLLNCVFLLYFESQFCVMVSFCKYIYSSCGFFIWLIFWKNIDIGLDFKKKKCCFEYDDVDFKSFGKIKILGICKYVIFFFYFKLLSKSDVYSFI